MHSPLARCARAHEAGSPTAPKPFFQVRPLGGDGLSLFELAFPDGQVAALYVSNYCGKPTYLGVLETVPGEPRHRSGSHTGNEHNVAKKTKKRHRHQRTVVGSWFPVARGEQLRMRSVHRARGLRMRGVSLHITSYVYL